MSHLSVVRMTLWLSVPFNLVAAVAIAWPASWLGQLFHMPADAPALYALLLGYVIALFGVAYGWMAASAMPNRGLLLAGVAGKTGVFVICVMLLATGDAHVMNLAVATCDLVFACIWGSWLLKARRRSLS